MTTQLKHNIQIVTGHYGSGKTEFSVNYALSLKESGQNVILVDLDIVNPYFRSNDAKELLEQAGVTLIAPDYAGTNVDIPALPPQIMRIFEENDAYIILDVGGDDDGAIALSRYKKYFDESGYEMYLIINSRRPLTSTADEIIRMKDDIEAASRLKVTGLVADTNLAEETTAEIIMEGVEVAEEVSRKTGLPIKFVCSSDKAAEQLPPNLKYQLLKIQNHISKI